MNILPGKLGNPVQFLKKLKTKPESYWIKRGENRALKLFHGMASRVPAYKDFLKKHRISPEKIQTIEDFKLLPRIDKHNYLRVYPFEKLCWDGIFDKKRWTFSVTSGSTGTPYYFPRENLQDWQYAFTAELYLLNQFEIDKNSTLYINCFAMGAWIGGLFTYQAVKLLADRGKYPLSIITPGLNKPEIIKAFRALAKHFDQIIIGGYPPFIKDLIDEALSEGIRFEDHAVKFIFSAEAFSETFRDYIVKKASLKNVYRDTLNHYGTVDQGTLSHETPISILLRRLALKHHSFYTYLFGETFKLPTLTQFLPELFFFEEESGDIICSAFSGLPLTRYDLHDHGGIRSFEKTVNECGAHGINVMKEATEARIEDTLWHLPFVHVYERSDLSVSLYGGNVYPETIRNALQNPTLENMTTGKFSMLIKHDEHENAYLEINIELKPNIRPSSRLGKYTTKLIVERLLKENSEYTTLYSHMREKLIPRIQFWPYEHELYFKSGGKQKWVRK